MRRLPASLFSAFVLGLSAHLSVGLPDADAATMAGVFVRSGDLVTAELDSTTDEDCILIDLAEGSTLSFSMKVDKKAPLLPGFRLFRPDGGEVNIDTLVFGVSTPKVRFTLPGISQTGTWALCIKGELGTFGPYSAQMKEKRLSKKASKGDVVPAGGSREYRFGADTDSELSFTVTQKSGSTEVLAHVLDPEGEEISEANALISRKKTKISGKKIELSAGFGNYAVRVSNPGGADALVDFKGAIKGVKVKPTKFTLGVEPRPVTFSPNVGRDGVLVTITGTGFADGATVLFGSTPADNVTVVSGTSITCLAPYGVNSVAGTKVSLLVSNADGQSGAIPGLFSFLGEPVGTSVSPNLSPLEGGITVTVFGTNFRAGATVMVDGVPGTSVNVLSTNTLNFVSPVQGAGPRDVVVIDEFARASAPVAGLIYSDPPTLVSASPASVPSFGFRTVVLTGSNFLNGDTVEVDGVVAADVQILTPTTLSFTMPPGAAGAPEVAVIDALGRSDESSSVLSRTRSLVHRPTAIPSGPTGSDFFGDRIAIGDIDGNSLPDVMVTTANPKVGGTGVLQATRMLKNQGSFLFADDTAAALPVFNGGNGGDFGQANATSLVNLTADTRAEALLSLTAALVNTNAGGFAYNGGFTGYWVDDTATFTATRFLLNDGAGKLTIATSSRITNPETVSTPANGTGERWQASLHLVGDIDGDTDQDVVLIQRGPLTKGTVASVNLTYRYVYKYYYNYKYPDKAYVTQGSTDIVRGRVMRNTSGNLAPITNAFPGFQYASGTLSEDFGADAGALGDIDGDNDRDMILVNLAGRRIVTSEGAYNLSGLRVLKNNGNGTFVTSPSSIPATYETNHPGSGDDWQGGAVALVDLTGDSRPEIVVGRPTFTYWNDGETKKLRPVLRIFRNNGSGTFTEDTGSFLEDDMFITGGADTLLSVKDIQTGDINGDGRVDLILTGSNFSVTNVNNTGFGVEGVLPAGLRSATRILLRTVSNTLVDGTKDWLPAGAGSDWLQADVVRVRDFDNDGFLDILLGGETAPFGVTGGRPIRILRSQ